MLIDSHAHLDMPQFEKDRDQVLERALRGGIKRIITIGVDLASSLKALELAQRYDFVFCSVGYHPHNAGASAPDVLKELAGLASEPKIVAWGEIGLDFYRRRSHPLKQIEVFEQQLAMAAQFGLPVIIHIREAYKEALHILQKKKEIRRGVIHCFSGTYDFAMTCIQMGFYISIPGIVTYKNALQVQEVASKIPLDHLLVETDAPYLTPVPKRGERNEPLYVTYTAQKIARLRHIDLSELARKTTENTSKLFSLPDGT